jgi:TonB family protein
MDRGEQLHVPIDDPQAAQNAYIKAMQANRRSSLAHFRIGELFLSQNNLQSAANEFRSAMNGDLNPKWTEVWSHIDLGKIFDITGQRDRAANEYQQAIRAHDNTFGAQSVARDGYEHATQSTVSGGSPNAAPTTPASPPIPPSVLEEESNLPRLGSPELERTLQGPSAPSKPSAYDVPPKLLYKAEPKYSEEARKAKYSGTVLLSVEIDTKGRVGAIRVVRPLGLGLDEKAIECVQKWKFRPALKDGRPVAVRVSIEISFRLL